MSPTTKLTVFTVITAVILGSLSAASSNASSSKPIAALQPVDPLVPPTPTSADQPAAPASDIDEETQHVLAFKAKVAEVKSAAADNGKLCRKIHWLPNRTYELKGHKNMSTHVVFPESAVDVIVGNKDLWTQEHEQNHVFIKPNTTLAEGNTSTLTFIGDSGNSYEFILTRTDNTDESDSCVVISHDNDMINSPNWHRQEKREKQVVAAVINMEEKQKSEIINQQRSALDQYRGTIYTRYQWKSTDSWFGQNFVSDVYDDGRWTYIRVTDDNKGVMSVYGLMHGKHNVLQFKYDETTKIYRISGIYPELMLAYGDNNVRITRQSK